jgi:peptidoglycan/LPS O-acetylase OafA/YrhL
MRRIPELDSIRGIAVFFVLISHTVFPNPILFKLSRPFYVGVDIFFVLSGYLITEIIIKNYQHKYFLKSFYARRSLRIWPIYYLMIFLILILGVMRLVPPLSIGEFFRYATYTQTYPFQPSGYKPHALLAFTWSLAVEEQFYMLWPALFLLVGRYRFVYVTFAVIALAIVCRAHGFDAGQINSRCDGLALGSLLALILADRLKAEQRPSWLVRAFVVVGLIAASAPIVMRLILRLCRPFAGELLGGQIRYAFDHFEFNLMVTCLIGLCVCYAGHPRLAVLRMKWLTFLGVISYGVFLYHPLTFFVAGKLCRTENGMTFPSMIVSYGLTIAVAAASWFAIEKPLLRLKDRFRY